MIFMIRAVYFSGAVGLIPDDDCRRLFCSPRAEYVAHAAVIPPSIANLIIRVAYYMLATSLFNASMCKAYHNDELVSSTHTCNQNTRICCQLSGLHRFDRLIS